MSRAVEVVPLCHTLHKRLASAPGQWLSRERLTRGVCGCQSVVEDALADLVIAHRAQYQHPGLYRAAGDQSNFSTNGGL